MPALDPSGFQMAVRIVTPDRQTFNLWWSEGASQTAETLSTVDSALGIEGPAALDGLPCVESVDIETAIGMNSKITISIAMPYDIGIRVLESNLLQIGNVIECQIGYPRIGRFMPWVSAMAGKPEVRINPDEGLTATLNGEGGAFIALRGSRSVEYQNKSYVDIVREILSQEGYAHISFAPPPSTGSDDELYRVRERVSQQNQSDWFFLQYLLRSANCDAWIEPSRDREGQQVLRCVRRSEILGATPRFGLVMRGRVDFETYFPLFEFESPSEGVWMPGAATSVRTGGINPDDLSVTDLVSMREDSTIPATGEAAPGEGGGQVEDTDVRLAHPTEGPTAGEHLYVSERDPRGQEAVAEAHQTEAAARGGGIQANVSTIGIPDLFPGELVSIHNLGIFDAVYLVHKVTHSCSSSEWSMAMDLLNNATSRTLLASLLSFTPQRVNDATLTEPLGDAEGGGQMVEPVEEG